MEISARFPARASDMADGQVSGRLGGRAVQPTVSGAVPGWLRHVRHYARSLSYLGLVFGWLFLLMSLTPSLLPRSWQVQGFVSGCAVVQGYGLGVVFAWAGRRLRIPRPDAVVMRRAWYVLGVLALVTIPVTLWLSGGWQVEVRRAAGEHASASYLYVGVLVIAVAVAACIVGAVRLIHDVYLALAGRLLRRRLPQLLVRVTAAVLVAALTVGLVTRVINPVALRIADAIFSSVNNGDAPGVSRPSSPFRSGSPSSLVAWDFLGKQGRAFVAGGPTVAQIEHLTGRPAVEPIRVYAGLDSAPTLPGEAALVLRELKRTGAFHRALLAIAIPTGSGSVPESLAGPLEYMYGGNTAIASIQYSYLPSWLSFLSQRPRAQQAGRILFGTIYRYWSRLSPGHRPRLVATGLSLGAYGASSAFSSVADITTHTSGALVFGPPNATQLWSELTSGRAKGSPEWLPVWHGGQAVRFAASAGDLRLPGGALRHPRLVYLQHPSDAVVWWSPTLAMEEPGWLAGPRVITWMRWYPFVTFWQVTADLVVSTSVPPGHGHDYGPEIPTAWAAILHPPGWTSAETAMLTTLEATGNLP
jgi:uncharacterized membrane protein